MEYTHTHRCTHTCVLTHTHTDAHTSTHSHTDAKTHTHTIAKAHTHTIAKAQASTSTHTHMHTYIHTHTHSDSPTNRGTHTHSIHPTMGDQNVQYLTCLLVYCFWSAFLKEALRVENIQTSPTLRDTIEQGNRGLNPEGHGTGGGGGAYSRSPRE